MPLNLPLPDWVPWWGQLVILVGAILFGFAFLMMPFAVFGVKGRLDFLETQLDDILAELRMVASRLPDPDRPPAREPVFEELVRPAPTRGPSPAAQPVPAQMPAPQPMPTWMSPPVPAVPVPPSALRPRPPEPAPDMRRGEAGATTPPRFVAGREPQRDPPASVPRLPLPVERHAASRTDGPSGDWDDEEASLPPRRPLRATTLRDAGRDRSRSEPTLRWPPPR